MSNIIFESSSSRSSLSSDKKQLKCGGQSCRKCGACRDWYQHLNSDDVVKRSDANCNHQFMFRHELVRHPNRCQYQDYPLQSLICMCNDNHSKYS